jgi:hypothetical protein
MCHPGLPADVRAAATTAPREAPTPADHEQSSEEQSPEEQSLRNGER